MIELDVAEWSQIEAALTASQAAALQATGAVEARPSPSGTWRIESSSIIGVVTTDELELRILPKIRIGHLLFLLGYSSDDGWTRDPTQVGDIDDLVEAIATAYVLHAHAAVNPGLLQGYSAIEESGISVRGRIRFGDQLARHQGRPLPLEISYDEFTTDIPENRLLRAATDLLLRLPQLSVSNRRSLRHLKGLLIDVTAVPPSTPPKPTRLNRRYHSALTLGDLIVKGMAFTQHRGGRTATSFLFDMNRVYESFLSTALTRAFARHGGTIRLQHHTFLDTQNHIAVIPDISWWVDGMCCAVIDAKYKNIADETAKSGDIYQMLAYCITHDLQRGTLVYAAGAQPTQTHTIRHSGITIDVRALSLDQTPRALLSDIDVLAADLTAERRPRLGITQPALPLG